MFCCVVYFLYYLFITFNAKQHNNRKNHLIFMINCFYWPSRAERWVELRNTNKTQNTPIDRLESKLDRSEVLIGRQKKLIDWLAGSVKKCLWIWHSEHLEANQCAESSFSSIKMRKLFFITLWLYLKFKFFALPVCQILSFYHFITFVLFHWNWMWSLCDLNT